MKSLVRFLTVGFLLCFAGLAKGQIVTSFTPASLAIPAVGQTFTVDLMASGITNVVSLQFPIVFDSTILKLVAISNPFHPSFKTTLVVDPVNGNNVIVKPNGKLVAAWEANLTTFPTGITLAGTKRLFTMTFEVLRPCNTTFNLTANAPSPPGIAAPEIRNNQGALLTVNFSSGAVLTGGDCPQPVPTYSGSKVIANNIYIPAGEIGCMPVTVNDHKNIIAFQYAFEWANIPIVAFEGARAFDAKLPAFDPTLFAGFNPSGYAVATWAGSLKVTVPNVVFPMYEMCFKGTGAPGTNTSIVASKKGLGGTTPPSIDSVIVGNPLPKNIWSDTKTPVGATIFIVPSTPPADAVTFTADMDTVVPNAVTCLDVRVKNFKNLEYAEFAMKYDTLKLKYQQIKLGTNPLGLTAIQNDLDITELAGTDQNIFNDKTGVRHITVEENFGVGDTVRWVQFRYRSQGTPMTLIDGTSIFSVCFKALGAVGSSTDVKIGSFSSKPLSMIVPIGAWKPVPTSGVPVVAENGKVVVKSALSATLAATNPTCNGGTNGSINTTTQANACTGTLSYKWAGPGINAGNMTVANPTNLTAGTYTLTVTCSAGPVTSTATVTLTQPSAVAFANPPATVGVTCPGDANGSITLSMTGGTAPYNYTWSGPSSPGNTPNATSLKAGNYRVTVTDANNCAFNNNNNVIQVGTPAPITATSTTNPVKCFGGSNGSISLAISGGTAPYTVQWTGPNGFTGTGTSLNNLKAGDYTPIITDSKQCVQTSAAISVSAPATAMTATASSAGDVVCFGTKTGKATVTVNNGTSNFSYLWREVNTGVLASTAKDPDNLICGTYTVVVTDANQCVATSTAVTINCPGAALTVTATPTAATCGTNGKICLSISGGWSNKTVAWSATGISGECPSGVGSGTYKYTVTDEKGCAISDSAKVAGPPQFTLSETITHVTCFGAGNGAITVVPGGGAGSPYQVNWSGAANLVGPTISNLQPGQYTPVVTDKEGCSQSFPAYTVNGPAAIAVVDTNVTHQVGAGNNGAIEVTGVTGGTSPYSFSWTGPNGYTSTSQNIQNVAPGVYVLTVKDNNNCTFTASYEVKADFSATATLKKGACGLSKDGCITVNILGTAPGPYMVSWAGNTNPVTLTTTPADICQFAGGTAYTLIVTNSLGQVFTMQPVSVPVLDAPMYSAERTDPNEDLKNGVIKVKAVPANAPLGYAWSNGETGTNTIVQLDSGSYTVTITHFITGCTAVETYHLSRIYPPATFNWIEVTNPKCKASTDGVLRIQFSGADGPGYKYKWAGPAGVIAGAATTTLGGIGAGSYTVTVTDERGLTFVYDTVLVSQSLLAISTVDELSNINGFQVSGSTVCDGVALVSYAGQVGAVNIAWSNGVNTATNSTLCGGAYSVTVTDALGCSSVWTDALTAPPALTAASQITQAVSCSGECDGKARVTVSGGVAPYQVAWSNGQKETISTASGYSESVELCGGIYTITVTDKSGITTVHTVNLPDPAPITLAFAAQQPSAFSTCDGEVIATATGTTGITTWTWSVVNRPGKTGTEQRADGLCAGEVVQFSVVDANGCSAVGRDSVPYPPDGCLKIGPVITPNGDNLNDYFGITCIQGLKNVLEIYNRWGQLVYTAENYDSAPAGLIGAKYWDGKSSGQDLPEGTYFYVLNYTDEDGNAQQIKGYVTLLR